MGGCQSNADTTDSKVIDDLNKKDASAEDRIMKILLLGAGDSGKTTIFKQMKILHQAGYQESDRVAFKSIIYNNTLQGMKDILNALPRIGMHLPPYLSREADIVLSTDLQRGLTNDSALAIKALWSEGVVKNAFENRSRFQLQDAVSYYFDAIDRLNDPRYLPTDSDILRARSRTTGIVETSFTIDGITFRMYDVGGQRNERRKWIHCFDNVHAVLFVAAISEYDQVLFEDDSQNRMTEALSLFGEICNSRFFSNTAMILFLNKKDLFQEKINVVPLTVCFPEYTGPNTFDATVEYITQQFLDRNTDKVKKQVYVHMTTATDTSNVSFVFNAVKDIILQINLRGSGFI